MNGRNQASISVVRDATDTSRNDQPKSVPIAEVMRSVRTRSQRLRNQASINAVRDAINTSRNEQQKSVLIAEVMRSVCARSQRLIDQSKELLAESAVLRQRLSDSHMRSAWESFRNGIVG